MCALGYADDTTLTCPCVFGVNCMLDICNQFAKNKHVTFNTKKFELPYTTHRLILGPLLHKSLVM